MQPVRIRRRALLAGLGVGLSVGVFPEIARANEQSGAEGPGAETRQRRPHHGDHRLDADGEPDRRTGRALQAITRPVDPVGDDDRAGQRGDVRAQPRVALGRVHRDDATAGEDHPEDDAGP